MTSNRPLVIFTAAGEGRRLSDYIRLSNQSVSSKPLFEVHGKTLLEWSFKPLFPLITSDIIDFSDIFVVISVDACISDYKKVTSSISPLINIIQLSESTDSPITTSRLAIESIRKIKGTSSLSRPIIISDSDHFYICPNIKKFAARIVQNSISIVTSVLPGSEDSLWSHVTFKNQEIVRIIEKAPIIKPSNEYTSLGIVGLYGYKSANYFSKISHQYISSSTSSNTELSHAGLAGYLLSNFSLSNTDIHCESAVFATGLGTPEQLESFKEYSGLATSNIEPDTIICDIDGCIFVHDKGRFSLSGSFEENPRLLTKNIDWLKYKASLGSTIIFVTSRPNTEHNNLQNILKKFDIPFNYLVTGASSGTRLLLNDYKSNSLHETALSFSLDRNHDGSFDSVNSESTRLFNIRDVSKGSGAKTYILTDFNQDHRVRKLAKASSVEASTLLEQYQYLDELNSKQLSVPSIVEYCFQSKGTCWYDMRFVPGELFSSLSHSQKLNFIPLLVERICSLYESTLISNSFNLSDCINILWPTKVDPVFADALSRCKDWSYSNEASSILSCILTQGKNVQFYSLVSRLVDSVEFKRCSIHGDLTYENVIINPSTSEITFIDPLGGLMDPYSGRKFSYATSPFFDIGKLFQSHLCHYEQWSSYDSFQVSKTIEMLHHGDSAASLTKDISDISNLFAPFSEYLGSAYIELGIISCSIIMARVARYKLVQGSPSSALCLYYSVLLRDYFAAL